MTKFHKHSSRIFSVVSNSAKQMSGQVISLLLSVYVVRFYSKLLWGDFVSCLLFVSIALLFVSWGNKDFLLRAFSKTPSKMTHDFYVVFNTRLVLFVPVIAVVLFAFPIQQSSYIMGWIAAGYVAQSLEVFWIYKRNYLSSIAIEVVSFLLLMLLLYFDQELQLAGLIKWYCCYQWFRSALYAGLSFKEIKNINFKIDWLFFGTAVSFFLLSASGFLQSRTDFLVITLFEKSENIAIYQVLNTYFILIHAIGTFIILPFMKNLYRLQVHSMEKIQRQLVFAAPFIVTLSLSILYLIIRFIYHFNLDFGYYLIGFFITFPPYLYAVKIIRLFRENRQKVVLSTSFKAIAINSFFSFALLHFGYGLKGALIGAAIAQIFTAFQYLKLTPFEK